MSHIRVVRNKAGNCINFVGTTNPAYWNACLSAQVDSQDPNSINVINDIRSASAEETIYEFYRIPYTQFSDRDGNEFNSAQEAADYITLNANVATNIGADIEVTPQDHFDFQQDVSGTTIFIDNGDAYSINELLASDPGNGTITITKRFSNNPENINVMYNINHENVTIAGGPAGTTLSGVINALNSLFTYAPLGGGGSLPLPSQPTDGGVAVTGNDSEGIIPVTGTPTHLLGSGPDKSGHGARYWSDETIDEAGEYFTVKITGRGRFILGLGSESDGDRLEMESDAGAAADGLLWGNAFYNYGSYIAPWTTYGSSSTLSYGPGWNGSQDKMYRYNTNVQDAHVNLDPILFRVGIDQQGYISVWYYDIGRSNDWILTARHSLTTPAGEYFLVVKLWDGNTTLVETPLRFANDPTAPVLNYRFIESPDGAFTYPLFASADEAAYVDVLNGGIGVGSAHVHVYPDDPTSSTWYMPNNGGFMGISTAPTSTVDLTYTEIPTLADDLYAPAPLTLSDYSVSENATVNIQLLAQDTPATVTGLPAGLVYSNGFITGTAPYVIRDEDYSVTVTRSNPYGTTAQTFTITVTDNASLSDIAGFTEIAGNFVQPNRIILDHDALLRYDTVLSPGQQMTYSYGGPTGGPPPTIGILSGIGTSNLAAFDPATDTLDVAGSFANPGFNFGFRSQWALRYTTFGGYIGGTGKEKFYLTGWADNTTQPGNEGDNANVEFKLEYGNDGFIRLYRGGVLKLTSASTFTGDQDIYFFGGAVQGDVYIPSNLGITSSFNASAPPAGFVNPVESGQMTSPTLFGPDTDGAVFVSETLKVNHRYIVPRTWIEANVLPNITGSGAGVGGEKFFFGVPRDGTDLTSISLVQDFRAVFRLEGGTNNHYSRLYTNGISGSADDTVLVASNTNAFYDYAIEWDGTDLHVIACNLGDINTQPAISQGGAFSRVTTLTDFGPDHGKTNQELNLVICIKDEGSVNLSTVGLQQIRTPWSQNTILVGESSSGNGQFGQVPSTQFDVAGQHAPNSVGYKHPTVNAGYTYTYIYDPSLEDDDGIEFRLASDNTTVYTTGITSFDNTTNGDPSNIGTQGYKGLIFNIPQGVPPLRAYFYNEYQSGSFDAGRDVPISGSTYTVPVTGITTEGPSDSFDGNLVESGANGWLQLVEDLSAGERLVLDSAFIQDLHAAMPDHSVVFVGLKDGSWTDEVPSQGPMSAGWKGRHAIRFYKTSASIGEPGIRMKIYSTPGGTSSEVYTADLTNAQAFIEVTNSGNNIRSGVTASSSYSSSTTAYADWDGNLKIQTGDQGYGITSIEPMFLVFLDITQNTEDFDITEVDWEGLSEVSIPQPSAPLTTPWTKGLDFGGGSQRAIQVTNTSTYSPIRMGNSAIEVSNNVDVTKTSADASAFPWAVACVFKSDGNASNQHIWNQGEGSGSNDDNIFLRLDSTGDLYFSWGRQGSINECLVLENVDTTKWYGVYVASKGGRFNTLTATPANLAAAFDIRIFDASSNWTTGTQRSTEANWVATGGRMDRSVEGTFTVGGRGSNRSFHGTLASTVVTTLLADTTLPGDAEVRMLVRDPLQWLQDYKIGNPFKASFNSSTNPSFSLNDAFSASATQVWLMGDGTFDAYAKIRNQVYPSTQNNTPLDMVSMISSDIQTVNISGLT